MKKEDGFIVTLIVVVGLTVIILAAGLIIWLYNTPEPEKAKLNTVRIPQNIGGELICNVERKPDDSLNCIVSYYYKNGSDSALFLGEGKFEGLEWQPAEQLLKIGDWYYLRTGAGRKGETLNFGKLEAGSQWWNFAFTPMQVEKDTVWKSYGAYTIPEHPSSFMRVISIDTLLGSIFVLYKFPSPNSPSTTLRSWAIEYQINEDTGEPNIDGAFFIE